jgi:hypothetical protein
MEQKNLSITALVTFLSNTAPGNTKALFNKKFREEVIVYFP